MSVVCPGLVAEAPVMKLRLALGQMPALPVQKRLTRHLRHLQPWFLSRPRVNETGSLFMELDVASGDHEILLSHAQIGALRDHIVREAVAKQAAWLETAKVPKEAQPNVLACLQDCNADAVARLEFEETLMGKAKTVPKPYRREASADSKFERADALLLHRWVAEDATSADAEGAARAYLPQSAVATACLVLGDALLAEQPGRRTALDKRELKLLERVLPRDYDKIGAVPKLRPVDATALHRFYGERLCVAEPDKDGRPANPGTASFFRRCLWGHVFRRYATHPSYLRYASRYWPIDAGITDGNGATPEHMPDATAAAVCTQQLALPATRFRAHYLYTSVDLVKQQWQTETVVPMGRLLPLIGAAAADDLLAHVLVDAHWAKLALQPGANALRDDVAKGLRAFVKDAADRYETNIDALLQRVRDAMPLAVPALTEAEIAASKGTPAEASDAGAGAATGETPAESAAKAGEAAPATPESPSA